MKIKLALDRKVIDGLTTNFSEVEDDSVAQCMAEMLHRKVIIISSDSEKRKCFIPFIQTYDLQENEDVVLGHVLNHHFVPLKLKSKHILRYYFHRIFHI